MALDQTELAQIVSAVIQALKVGDTGAKAAPAAKPTDKLAQRDRSIISGFKRQGIQDVVLMDRNDKSKPFNVRPYRDWIAAGWQVRKGQRSVRGLFHQSQCDRIAPKAQPKAKAAKPAQSKPSQLPLA